MASTNNHQAARGIGAWPFVTRREVIRADGAKSIWSSRHHRKSLDPHTPINFSSSLWMPRELNWWIGVLFSLGSLLFIVASGLSLIPSVEQRWLTEEGINGIYFIGSLPFTIAASLALLQAYNAVNDSTRPWRRLAWHPLDVGLLACALQFLGTILFNVNTLDSMIPSLNWFEQDLAVWAPNLLGSILFLAAGYLCFIETCHAYWAIQLNDISWWVTATNLLGCVGFIVSALLAVILPTPSPDRIVAASVCTLIGATFFLISSLLMLPEAAKKQSLSTATSK